MSFRKPWHRVKSANFDFSAELSSTDITNRISQPIESEKSLVKLGVPKNKFFTFSHFSLY